MNVQWTLELFKLATTRQIHCFMYVSSVAALGYINRPEPNILTEETTPLLHEQEFYGRSKLMAEERLQEAAHDKNIRLVILRPGLIYGKRMVNTAQSWLRRGSIINSGTRIPFIYIDNFVDALKCVLERKEAKGVFLVVDDEQPNQKEVITLKKNLGILKYSPWEIGLNGFILQQQMKTVLRRILGNKNITRQPALEPLIRFHSRELRYDCSRLKKNDQLQPNGCSSDATKTSLSHDTKNIEFSNCLEEQKEPEINARNSALVAEILSSVQNRKGKTHGQV